MVSNVSVIGDSISFSIIFEFDSENRPFSDERLVKHFYTSLPESEKFRCGSVKIHWKEGEDLNHGVTDICCSPPPLVNQDNKCLCQRLSEEQFAGCETLFAILFAYSDDQCSISDWNDVDADGIIRANYHDALCMLGQDLALFIKNHLVKRPAEFVAQVVDLNQGVWEAFRADIALPDEGSIGSDFDPSKEKVSDEGSDVSNLVGVIHDDVASGRYEASSDHDSSTVTQISSEGWGSSYSIPHCLKPDSPEPPSWEDELRRPRQPRQQVILRWLDSHCARCAAMKKEDLDHAMDECPFLAMGPQCIPNILAVCESDCDRYWDELCCVLNDTDRSSAEWSSLLYRWTHSICAQRQVSVKTRSAHSKTMDCDTTRKRKRAGSGQSKKPHKLSCQNLAVHTRELGTYHSPH